MRILPPPKQPGRQSGPRRISGELLDVRAVAEYLGESEKAVRAQISRGMLPHRRLGGRIVCRRAELEAYLEGLPGVSVDEAITATVTRKGGEQSMNRGKQTPRWQDPGPQTKLEN